MMINLAKWRVLTPDIKSWRLSLKVVGLSYLTWTHKAGVESCHSWVIAVAVGIGTC